MNRGTRAVVANGLRFAYLEAGEGPLVLLFHGFPDTPHTWDDLGPRIAAKGYRVVAPFTRGYRPTEVPARDAELETLARDDCALPLRPPAHLRARIAVPTVASFGTGDPQVGLADFERARKMFTGSYTIEALPGGHVLHREHPEECAARLLAHL